MDAVAAREVALPRSWWTARRRGYLLALAFILPAVVNFVIFRYLPIFAAIRSSLWQYSLLGGYGEFIGLQAYLRMLEDPIFWKSLWVTTAYVLMKVPAQIVLSMGLALLLQRESRFTAVVRSAIFAPVVTSIVVISVIWALMYHVQLGLLNSIITSVGLPRIAFLSNPRLALVAIVIMMVWKEIGFSMIILMAGLKGIPDMYFEAARIDGASGWQQFWRITLPLLRRVLMFVVVTQTIFSFQVFVPVYTMTRGGPLDATKVIVYYIYQNGFLFQDMGYAAAISTVTLIVLLVVSAVQMWLLRSEVEY
ncbi:MAG: sugar ABC transporter permease [Armatimonadota bacterium]|nr:sugar ABC transporter permease [Armatimonadota bacterium]MDR7402717.1 sugar ABC transporter permease [Armatimonadota bacterium]MDR7403508.1 sugar ABC transporter permease [Armatimonadota bacterium]MDR7506487.1 sugar ABC transporter permease [Armatimonadota bacterium]MDR7509852.1 sugar ABC transporter permease [Armatimonadota bacterium]